MPSLLSDLDNSLSSLVMMHLGLLLFEVGEKWKISRCTESNFLSTLIVLYLPPQKLSLSPQSNCDELISESGDVKDNDSGAVLEEFFA